MNLQLRMGGQGMGLRHARSSIASCCRPAPCSSRCSGPGIPGWRRTGVSRANGSEGGAATEDRKIKQTLADLDSLLGIVEEPEKEEQVTKHSPHYLNCRV